MATDNKRIAKNTAFMYFRMALTMIIGLFSVRIVLKVLGAEDYGIYNVTCGVVSLMAFLNNALSSSTQRFLSFEMGRNDYIKVKKIFSNSLFLYLLLAIVILIVAETLGLWFVNYKLVIPTDRLFAANWIYQFSIISFCLSVIQSPFVATIISHEKMGVYAYISIGESILKIAMIVLLFYLPGDKLIVYGICMLLITVTIFLFYIFYSLRHFIECGTKIFVEKGILKEITGFTSWSTLGAISNIFMGQGINFILNLFFGPIINAARALAFQVDAAINTLIQNFYIAARPQVTKEFAQGNIEGTYKLFSVVCRFGFFLMLIMSFIFFFETEFILKFWLGDYPEKTVIFTRLTIVSMLIMSLNPPLNMLVNATGKIKYYQIFGSIINAMILPVSYACLLIWNNPIVPFVLTILFNVGNVINVSFYTCRNAGVKIRFYITLLLRIFSVSIIASIMPMLVYFSVSDSIYRAILITFASILMTVMSAYIWGTTKDEKIAIKSVVLKYMR